MRLHLQEVAREILRNGSVTLGNENESEENRTHVWISSVNLVWWPGRGKGNATVTDIRALKYSSDGNIEFKLNFEDDWQGLPKPRNMIQPDFDPPALFQDRIKIPESKYKHLQELKCVLPQCHHPFYDNLRHWIVVTLLSFLVLKYIFSKIIFSLEEYAILIQKSFSIFFVSKILVFLHDFKQFQVYSATHMYKLNYICFIYIICDNLTLFKQFGR